MLALQRVEFAESQPRAGFFVSKICRVELFLTCCLLVSIRRTLLSIEMNQTVLTITSIALSAALSAFSSAWLTSQARDKSEAEALAVITSEFRGVATSVNGLTATVAAQGNQQGKLTTRMERAERDVQDLYRLYREQERDGG